MSIEEQLNDLQITHRHTINQMLDTSKEKVRAAVKQLGVIMKSAELSVELKIAFFTRVALKNLVACLGHPSDSVRETAIDVADSAFSLPCDVSQHFEQFGHLLTQILARVDSIPFKEATEEVRVKICGLLLKLGKQSSSILTCDFAKLIEANRCLLEDKCPEVKRLACELVICLAKGFPERIGIASKRLSPSLTSCANHQQTKIRRVGLHALRSMMVCPGSAGVLSEVLEKVRPLFEDKSEEIRADYLSFVSEVLCSLSFEETKAHETELVLELLTPIGMEDQAEPELVKRAQLGLANFVERRNLMAQKYQSGGNSMPE